MSTTTEEAPEASNIPYHPPIKEMEFLLTHVLGDAKNKGQRDDFFEPIAEFASEVLAPQNGVGDVYGAKYDKETRIVTMPPGSIEAYRAFCELGLNGAPFPEDMGGSGFSNTTAFAVAEMCYGANVTLMLTPMLTLAAARAINLHGTEAQKAKYLPKLVSGEHAGTMVLTEAGAGSFLPALRASATPVPDEAGIFTINGPKTFITSGDHDLAGSDEDPKGNIIHTVLAKIPGSDRITMFIVPKYLDNGTLNNVLCDGIENKMGIHGSPTCKMMFDDARGELLGEGTEGQGLRQMFTMMNEARLQVGLQGVGVADRAYQAALAYSQERVQGIGADGKPCTIIHHADVQRMILTAKSKVEATRSLAYSAGVALDKAEANEEGAQARVDLLTPMVKAWSTDVCCEVTDLAMEVLGGYGYIRDYGVEQMARDARIFTKYEGANGIQCGDLANRKVGKSKDQGAVVSTYIDELQSMTTEAGVYNDFALCFKHLRMVTDNLLQLGIDLNDDEIGAASRPYLAAISTIAGGVLLARSAQKAAELDDPALAHDKAVTSQFYTANVLPGAIADLKAAMSGAHVLSAADTSFLLDLRPS